MGGGVLRILEPGDEALLEAFLLPRVESSMFLLGNMRDSGLRDRGEPYEGSYAAMVEDGRITGVVAHFWNAVLVFQAPGNENLLWKAAAEASGRRVAGLIGPNDQVEVARRALPVPAEGVQLDTREKLYSLALEEMVVPEALSSGEVDGRRIGPADVELVTAWQVAYDVEALGAKEAPEAWSENRERVKRSLKEGRTWVLERQGEAVSCSSFNTAVAEAVQIGGVWTPPELRRRGYGRCVVAASLLQARAEGVETAILFTGEENVAAQRAYTALGFRHIGDYRLVLLDPPIDP
ncbi:MAG: GNAT family N-acetyltransferase [Anaerolineae bacterium]|jgi:predicted GNAT family acetyltransferase